MLILPLTGCLAPEDNRIVVEEPTIFDFLNPIPETTWFHYSGAVDALDSESIESANLTVDLSGDNVPFWTQGSYYGIGMTTFEPTMGITSSDNLYMSSWTYCVITAHPHIVCSCPSCSAFIQCIIEHRSRFARPIPVKHLSNSYRT